MMDIFTIKYINIMVSIIPQQTVKTPFLVDR